MSDHTPEAQANALRAEIERLRDAIDKSLALQNHYAKLLNMYDGGQRMQFVGADDWLARLAALEHTE